MEQREKHRIQLLLLKEIYSVDKEIVFKGGTALEVAYGLDRFSEDLDFDTDIEKASGIDEAIENLDSKVIAVENDWAAEIRRQPNMHIYLLDFYSSIANARLTLKLDAVFERCIHQPKKKTISVAGNPVTMSIMDEGEMLAEKVSSIMNERRNQPRDLYDLRFLIMENTQIDLHLIYSKSKSKVFGNTKRYSISGFSDRVYSLEDRWQELRPYLRKLPGFKDVADYVISRMRIVS